jgi:hypothetical protein
MKRIGKVLSSCLAVILAGHPLRDAIKRDAGHDLQSEEPPHTHVESIEPEPILVLAPVVGTPGSAPVMAPYGWEEAANIVVRMQHELQRRQAWIASSTSVSGTPACLMSNLTK